MLDYSKKVVFVGSGSEACSTPTLRIKSMIRLTGGEVRGDIEIENWVERPTIRLLRLSGGMLLA